MSRKFSASRKRAFLTYLAQTGNITLSAERAKVSRSWVCLHRSGDAEFDSACRKAIGEAKERLKAGPPGQEQTLPLPPPASGRGEASRKPPENWAYHQGEELVVNGSNGRRVQVRRAKLSQWTARVEDRFLSVLAATCNVKEACREVGLWPPSAYNHRKRWPDFARRWDQAIAIGTVELECRLHETIRHFFDRELPEPQAPLRDITVMDAIRLLRMYRAKER
jgi:hypothetical protein